MFAHPQVPTDPIPIAVHQGALQDEDNLSNDPMAAEVKMWRHTLQRAFLTQNRPPRIEEMDQHDYTFRIVEARAHELSIAYLQHSKIGKVARMIATLPASHIPREEEFRFRERAARLVGIWQNIVIMGRSENPSIPPASNQVGTGSEPSALGNVSEPLNIPNAEPDHAVVSN